MKLQAFKLPQIPKSPIDKLNFIHTHFSENIFFILYQLECF